MRTAVLLLVGSVACDAGGPASQPRPASSLAVVRDAASAPVVAMDASHEPAPRACVPPDESSWTCPELVASADGPDVVVCLREGCGPNANHERACMRVDPQTGAVVGSAAWPAAPQPVTVPLSSFELRPDGSAVDVCNHETCTRVADTDEASNVVVDATGQHLFVANNEDGEAIDVATGKRRHVTYAFPDNEPPPPTSTNDTRYFGHAILLGDFDDQGTIDRAVDPSSGHFILLDKPWVTLPGDLVAHFTTSSPTAGEVDLLDFDAHMTVVARRRTGHPHQPTEAVAGVIAVVGDGALVVTQDPPATLFVDAHARTISKARPLPICR